MKKIIVTLVMTVFCAMPILAHASDAAKSAGQSGGSAAAGSISTGYIAAGAVGVAVVGGIALSSGGSGSSGSTTDTDTVAANTKASATMDLIALAEAGNDVDAVFTALANAAAAGLTAADIQAAMEEAGIRAITAENQAAYDALVAAFQTAGADSATAAAIVSMVDNITDDDVADFVKLNAIVKNPTALAALKATIASGGTALKNSATLAATLKAIVDLYDAEDPDAFVADLVEYLDSSEDLADIIDQDVLDEIIASAHHAASHH